MSAYPQDVFQTPACLIAAILSACLPPNCLLSASLSACRRHDCLSPGCLLAASLSDYRYPVCVPLACLPAAKLSACRWPVCLSVPLACLPAASLSACRQPFDSNALCSGVPFLKALLAVCLPACRQSLFSSISLSNAFWLVSTALCAASLSVCVRIRKYIYHATRMDQLFVSDVWRCGP
jgi:hypothetical protein